MTNGRASGVVAVALATGELHTFHAKALSLPPAIMDVSLK